MTTPLMILGPGGDYLTRYVPQGVGLVKKFGQSGESDDRGPALRPWSGRARDTGISQGRDGNVRYTPHRPRGLRLVPLALETARQVICDRLELGGVPQLALVGGKITGYA